MKISVRRWIPKNKGVRFILLFLLAWMILHLSYVVYDGLKNEPPVSDVAIVLGNTVYNDGSVARWTQGRLDRAYDLYKEGKVKIVFVSGGLGVGEYHYPEGKAMKAYLVGRGMPDSSVIEDNAGANTYLTAINFNEWNKTKGYKRVIAVSQFFHITRTKYILRKTGFEGGLSSASSTYYTWKDGFGLLREFPAFYKYLLIY